MQSLKIGEKTWEVPGNWREVPARQYRKAILFLGTDNAYNRTCVLLALIKRPAALKKSLKALGKQEGEDSNVIWQILEVVRWCFSLAPVNAKTEVQPIISSFTHHGKVYHLPQASLNDVTIGEWLAVVSYYRKYAKSPNETDLMKLAAAICRPRKSAKALKAADYDGYPRIKFNPETVEQRSNDLKGVRPGVLHAVLDYVIRCSQLLKVRYKPLYEGESSDGPNFGWYGTILSLAESGTFGTEREVNDQLIHKCCIYLVKKLAEKKAFEEKLKKLKPKRP